MMIKRTLLVKSGFKGLTIDLGTDNQKHTLKSTNDDFLILFSPLLLKSYDIVYILMVTKRLKDLKNNNHSYSDEESS